MLEDRIAQTPAAAVLDSISAAIKRIAYVTLTTEWDAAEEFFRGVYGDENHFNGARTTLEKGQGIGRDAIAKYLDGRISDAVGDL